jgi:hypothetical protein
VAVIKNFIKVLIFINMMVVGVSFADGLVTESHGFFPTESKYANWVFFGMVENESGEVYDYFFQIHRNNNHFRAIVALFNSQTKKIVFKEDSTTTIENPNSLKWEVGRAFLKFNKITNSWVFGLNDHNKNGFNFKVGMLNRPGDDPVTQYFNEGISFVVVQAGQLNGHIHVESDGKDQFVTAKNTWFRQIWLTDLKKMQQLNGLLCRFNDGGGLYSMRVFQSSELRDTVAGLFDSEGSSLAISQFIHIEKNKDDSWNIKITTPKMDLMLTDTHKQNQVVAGFIANASSYGFCMLSQDEIGDASVPERIEGSSTGIVLDHGESAPHSG